MAQGIELISNKSEKDHPHEKGPGGDIYFLLRVAGQRSLMEADAGCRCFVNKA